MTAEETIASLEAQLKQALERLNEVTEQLRVAQARIEELEKLKTPPPAFVKAKKKKPEEEQKKARKKRDARHNRGRPRSTPTQIVEHRMVTCPECHLRLGGISLARLREVINVPPPAPVEVTEHRIYKGWCAGCQKWHEAPVDLQDQDEQLFTWAKSVKAIYDEAVAWVEDGLEQNASPRKQSLARVAQQHAFEQHLWQVCQPSVHTTAPQHILCERVERFLPELFVFVAVPGVPAHNNLAERSVRPLVVARKISGGTRSPKGSETRMGLASLFGTWMAQKLNPFLQCLAALPMKSSLGQV